MADHNVISPRTCHNDGLSKILEHETQSGAGVSKAISAMQNNEAVE